MKSAAQDDWPFLDDAWRYALVLTGSETAALELVRASLNKLARRSDASDTARARRILFASLYRKSRAHPLSSSTATEAERRTRPLHELSEPGRSALTLLGLRLFAGEDLAGLLGESLPSLAQCLADARARVALPPIP